MLTGAVTEGLTASEGSIPKMTHSHGWQAGAGCWQEVSLPPCGPLFRAAEISADSPRVNEPRKSMTEVPLQRIHSVLIGYTGQSYQCGRG